MEDKETQVDDKSDKTLCLSLSAKQLLSLRDNNGGSILHVASSTAQSEKKPSDLDVFRLLGEVEFELKDYEGTVAAYKSSAKIVDCIAKSVFDKEFVHYSANNGYLAKHGADINLANDCGRTPLHYVFTRERDQASEYKKYAGYIQAAGVEVHFHGPCHVIIFNNTPNNHQQGSESVDQGSEASNQNSFHSSNDVNGPQPPPPMPPIHVHVFYDNDGLGYVHQHNLVLVGVLDINMCYSWALFGLMIRDLHPHPIPIDPIADAETIWPGRIAFFDSNELAGVFEFEVTDWLIARDNCRRVRLVLDDEEELDWMQEFEAEMQEVEPEVQEFEPDMQEVEPEVQEFEPEPDMEDSVVTD